MRNRDRHRQRKREGWKQSKKEAKRKEEKETRETWIKTRIVKETEKKYLRAPLVSAARNNPGSGR